MKLRVAVLYGGTSAEHEVSVVSARSVLRAIDRATYEVLPVAITKSGQWLLPARAPDELPEVAGTLPAVEAGLPVVVKREGVIAEGGLALTGPVDVVFPVLHGPGGEDGTVQGMLDVLGIPYVGAGVTASAVGMDKSLQKPIFERAGIPVTPWVEVRARDFENDPVRVADAARGTIEFPCFTKPAALGSSVGVSKCGDLEELVNGLRMAFEHGGIALVEHAVKGRELECGVLGNADARASVVGEIVPVNEFYDYEAKYLIEGSEAIIPADLPDAVAAQIQELSLRAFHAIGCAGMARVDFFLSTEGQLLCNEINTIPGFTPISMYPKLWEASGVPYPALIDRLIELALARARR